MAVKIRLTRTGVKRHPSYRIVVADSRKPRDGRFIEIIGHYHPVDGGNMDIEGEKALLWLMKGAQPTQKAKDLLKRAGVWKKFKEKESVEVVE